MISTSIVVHNGIPFHPIDNPIKYRTPLVQFAQHHVINTSRLNPYHISKHPNEQFKMVFEVDKHEQFTPENIELAIVALLQANITLNLQATVPMPMPKSLYDRKSNE
jgi:hypothetical protein